MHQEFKSGNICFDGRKQNTYLNGVTTLIPSFNWRSLSNCQYFNTIEDDDSD
ncbi:hypothetical protein L9F63_024672, partial [Diploptera punctata]